MKWEYKTVSNIRYLSFSDRDVFDELTEEALNELGEEGWELVTGIYNNFDLVKATFKRPME